MRIPGYTLIKGATITRAYDATGREFIGCVAQKGDDKATFGFHIFAGGKDISYTPFCDARGSLTPGGLWIAFHEDGSYDAGAIPGFVSHPSQTALASEITALKKQIAALEARPAGGALDARQTKALEKLCTMLGL